MKLAQKLAVNYIRARLNLLAVISKKRAAKKAFDLFCTPFNKNNRPLPPVFVKAEQLSITVKNTRVRGFRFNKGGIKKVLILHGFESSVRNFDAYVTALVKKNYEVLAFDAPAHGDSGGKYITLPLYIEMITAIHFQFGIVQSFIGHSFGGLAVTHFLEKIPTSGEVKLALIAPMTETTTAIRSFFRFLQLSDTVRSEFERLVCEKTGAEPAYFSIPRALKHVKASVLWIHDKDDDITPFTDIGPVMQAAYSNVSFLITSGLGHKKIYRDSQVIKTVVDFL